MRIVTPFLTWFHNLKFRKKTMVAFLGVSLIPLFLLGSFCFFETRSLLAAQARNNLAASLEQAALTINSQINTYSKISSALCYNKSLAIAANTEYESPYAMFEQLRYTIDELFVTTQNLAPGIEGITLYTGTNLPSHGKTTAPIEEAAGMPWYPLAKDSVSAVWYPEKEYLYCIQPILYTQISNPKENMVVTRILKSQILNPAILLAEREMGVLLTDENGRVVYEHSPFLSIEDMLTQSPGKNPDEKEKESGQATMGQRRYTFMRTNLEETGWDMLIYVPTSELNRPAGLITLTVLLMIVFCLVLVYLSSRAFAGKMVYRIEDLRENMKTVENGSLKVTATSDDMDEIGELIQGFGKMVRQIDRLIQENYEAEISRKESEMKALQAQINPHFLYNSLSLINWRALRIHADDISQMAQLLSSFYRTTLNKGKNMISVSDELVNVKSYLKIQLIMHSDSFDVDYEIEEELMAFSMPNLMLQPLVENSIVHGIENRESGRGWIRLSCQKRGGDILFTVEDNGIGIREEELPGLLEKSSNGYGIKNVNERARLLFGQEYGLTIESVYGKGTKAILLIPGNGDRVQLFQES